MLKCCFDCWQSVRTPTEDLSTKQQYLPINNTCTDEHTIAEQPTTPKNDEEKDARPSHQDFSDVTEQNRDINQELHEESVLKPNSNTHSETIYERHIQHKLDVAVYCMDQRLDDNLVTLSQEGRAILQSLNEKSVKLKDADKGVREFSPELSSDWYDDVTITDEVIAEFEKFKEHSGYNEVINKLEKSNSKWKQPTINIAVTGESGTGKSTLINSLRGMKANDAGAAKTGCTETTTEVTCYQHPEYPFLNVWDLPGVGTPNFTRDKYFEKVNFKDYDFLLLVSSSRFKENDLWLAKEIVKSTQNINLFFIRSKYDNDLYNFQQELRHELRPGERSQMAKEVVLEILDNLGKGGIKDARVFLINSHRTDTFDFEKLQISFIQTVSDLKRDAMILSLTTHSKEILERKVDVLRKQIPKIAHNAGLAASLSKPENDERPEITLLINEARLYAIQLGINIESLNTVAKNFRMDVSVLKKAVNMQSPAMLSSDKSFLQYYKTFDKCNPDTMSSGDIVRSVQSQCKTVLKNMLDMCLSESNKLHLQIADLSELESA